MEIVAEEDWRRIGGGVVKTVVQVADIVVEQEIVAVTKEIMAKTVAETVLEEKIVEDGGDCTGGEE